VIKNKFSGLGSIAAIVRGSPGQPITIVVARKNKLNNFEQYQKVQLSVTPTRWVCACSL
jgi:hypothetical protein